MARHRILDFFLFIQQRLFNAKEIPDDIVLKAFGDTLKDVNYHFPNLTEDDVLENITNNQNELAIFLFRLGRAVHEEKRDDLKPQIHFLLKDLCSCELYFNNQIDEGFYIVHGEGTVVGSRNTIGKGFMIHQGCTVGHKINGLGDGNHIGNNVKMYCNSSILGQLSIGNNVTIGAHTLVNKDVKDDVTIVSTSRMQTL
ncbi:MAG: hypothetical protein AAF901_04085 [Bacteroidota bacterium]